MSSKTPTLSIIVPVAPAEEAWRRLLVDIAAVNAEVLLVGSTTAPKNVPANVRWVASVPGRARQLNAGARAATGATLWFLHADSRITPAACSALERSLERDAHALWYFNLAFQDDGPRLMRINDAGVWVRSHLLGIPFGDQGFCLSCATFERLGGYREDAPYGEDHLLVWQARRLGVAVRCTGAVLSTSARKYRERGWTRTTIRHGLLTLRQALPEFLRWKLGR